ncbi:MAG: HAD family hydrolase [Spirochaetia bacterium]
MSVRWRSESIHPEEFLLPDRRLVLTLETLSRHVDLIAVTNNPVGVGVATLDVLGVREHLREVVGLESTGFSKPSVEPFREALRRLGADAEATISVGDRYDVDIAPALAVGMGAIHVAGVEEVYQLPGYLRDSGRLD